MTSVRQIVARIADEERQRELARQAVIEAALAKPPPRGVTKENWTDWHRRGWIVCPAKRLRTCSDPNCIIGSKCKRLAEIGLAGDRLPLPKKDRPRCGALTGSGTPCLLKVEAGKRRCRLHGGLSTGPRTVAGKARIAAAQRRRWADYTRDVSAPGDHRPYEHGEIGEQEGVELTENTPLEVIMTGAELKEIRKTFGLSASTMGRALGYSGPNANVAAHIRRLEREARPIPPTIARLAEMFWREGIPREWCP
jgi:hypothetical protein